MIKRKLSRAPPPKKKKMWQFCTTSFGFHAKGVWLWNGFSPGRIDMQCLLLCCIMTRRSEALLEGCPRTASPLPYNSQIVSLLLRLLQCSVLQSKGVPFKNTYRDHESVTAFEPLILHLAWHFWHTKHRSQSHALNYRTGRANAQTRFYILFWML